MSLEIWSYICTADIKCWPLFQDSEGTITSGEINNTSHESPADFHRNENKTAKIGELWFGEFVNSELFLTQVSAIDFHENVFVWHKGHGCVLTYKVVGCSIKGHFRAKTLKMRLWWFKTKIIWFLTQQWKSLLANK